MKFLLYVVVFICAILTYVSGEGRKKRQLTLGFGLPSSQGQGVSFGFGLPSNPAQNNGGQNLGNVVNGFLGNLFNQRPNPNQGQPVTINPMNIFNQFASAFNQNCQVNNGGCRQGCRMRQNRRQCYCNKGYILMNDGVSCLDIDECILAGERPCQDKCTNTAGSYECSCSGGRVLLSDGSSCSPPVSSCNVNNGGCEQRCLDTNAGPQCSCRNKFELNADGKSCRRKEQPTQGGNLCAINNGGCEQTCRVRRGNIRCSCQKGFELNPDGKTCNRKDEPGNPCQVGNGGCEQTCQVQNGQVQCLCLPGFKLSPDNKKCTPAPPTLPPVPVNPCEVNNGGCDQVCRFENGQSRCICYAGYAFENGVCKRVNEPFNPITFTTEAPKPQPETCGVNTKKSIFRTRIVGGQPADPKDWPWMAALLRKVGKSQFCGGTLISNKHVLTAAHCVYVLRPSDLYVRLGEYDFKEANENNPTDFRIDEIRVHNNYDSQTQENDIAILKMGRSSSFSEFIWPACLPPPEKSFESEKGYVTGWGTIEFLGPASPVLLEVVLPVWNQGECVKAYPENLIANTMMCVGLRSGRKDSCQGDSGGPFLIQILPSSRWYVAGIVSWGKGCAQEGRPGVYTRVNNYLDWIKQNTID